MEVDSASAPNRSLNRAGRGRDGVRLSGAGGFRGQRLEALAELLGKHPGLRRKLLPLGHPLEIRWILGDAEEVATLYKLPGFGGTTPWVTCGMATRVRRSTWGAHPTGPRHSRTWPWCHNGQLTNCFSSGNAAWRHSGHPIKDPKMQFQIIAVYLAEKNDRGPRPGETPCAGPGGDLDGVFAAH